MPKRKFNMTRSSMSYNKPYAGKRRRYAPKYSPVVRQAVRAAKKSVANMRTGGYLGIEKKFLDCAWNGVAMNSTTDGAGGELQPSVGCTGCISVPAQGDGESNRDGRQWTITDVFVSGVIATTADPDEADPDPDVGHYVALVLDTQANGVTLDSEDVFVNPSTGGFAVLPQPLRNLQFSKRFRVLAQQYIAPRGMYAMTDGASTASIVPQQNPAFKLGWKGAIKCLASGTTADVASATDNAIHLVGYTAKTQFTPVVWAKSRVRFVG